jgi:hypothetical protein
MAKTYILEPDEFSDHPRNDLEGIDDLLDDILGLKESDDDEVPTPEPESEPDEGGMPK